jgi:hypothetical protein
MSLILNGNKRLAICPIILVFPKDFLGIYSRTIRFLKNISLSYAIPGLKEKLWLDYSLATSTLNQMQVLEPDNDANVHLR